MSKITLEFDLPEEHNDMLCAIHGSAWALIAWDLDLVLRDEIKHTFREEFQSIRDELHSLIELYNVSFDMIS